MPAAVLVDTSVWIDHLSKGNARLGAMLEEGAVVCHPFVVGELACGNLANRAELLELLSALPQSEQVQHELVLRLLERRHLMGKGIGWVDMHLLASSMVSGAAIWTLDKRLGAVASAIGIAVS